MVALIRTTTNDRPRWDMVIRERDVHVRGVGKLRRTEMTAKRGGVEFLRDGCGRVRWFVDTFKLIDAVRDYDREMV